ncbi:MAG: porin family protein [Chitinophagaceae bacterium]
MKKVLFILTVIMLYLQLPAVAQKAKVGLEAGIAISNFSGNLNGKNTDYQSRTGLTAGMVVDMPIGKTNFSFRPSVNYVQKGAVTIETMNEKEYYALRYAEFAFNFLYHTSSKTGGVGFFIGLGPSVSLNLPSKSVVETGSTKVESNLILGNEGAAVLRGIDYGATGLAGVELKKNCFLSFSYNYGLRNLIPDTKQVISPSDELKSRTFAIKVGFLLNNK